VSVLSPVLLTKPFVRVSLRKIEGCDAESFQDTSNNKIIKEPAFQKLNLCSRI
jgi:hypothetical protein